MAARRGAKKKAARRATGRRPVAKRAPVKRSKVRKARVAAKPVKAVKAVKAVKTAKKKTARRKPLAKRPAVRSAKKAAPKRARVRQAPAKLSPAKQAAVKKAAVKHAVAPEFAPAFEPQRQLANPKELLLFDMQRARVAVMASIQGLTAPSADRPTAPGKWSVREIVLHLIVRDRVRLDEFDAVLGGRSPSWTGLDEPAMARVNELHLGPLRPLSWEEAVRLLQATREQLVATLVSVPSHPAELWTEAHPFGAMLLALPRHDRHHAEQIKSARIEG